MIIEKFGKGRVDLGPINIICNVTDLRSSINELKMISVAYCDAIELNR